MKDTTKVLKRFMDLYPDDLDGVIELLKVAANMNPEFYPLLSLMLYKKGLNMEAETALKATLRSDPFDFVSAYLLGRIYEERGKMDEAAAYFERAYYIFPWQPEIREAFERTHKERMKAELEKIEVPEEIKLPGAEEDLKSLFEEIEAKLRSSKKDRSSKGA